jgi:hypothetical protein
MGHIVRDTGWCEIDVDTTVGRVFLQERWQYNWLTSPGTTAWTQKERRDFHNRADQSIWAAWSNHAALTVAGKSPFARNFAGKLIPINLDIRWVTARPHWTVNVTKVPPGNYRQSNVQWTARVINLDTEDFTTRTICSGTPRACQTQIPVAHEFGHTIGNTSTLARGDEYPDASPHSTDTGSIMHSGHQLRSRHFKTILDEMNRMIPDTTFTVGSV